MIEHSLVYIHATKPTRRFVGCGALVEGGYVATCRHVWKMATEAAAKSEPSEPLRVEVEYPHALRNGVPTRYPAQIADACENDASSPHLDLVLLQPDDVPRRQVRRPGPPRSSSVVEAVQIGQEAHPFGDPLRAHGTDGRARADCAGVPKGSRQPVSSERVDGGRNGVR